MRNFFLILSCLLTGSWGVAQEIDLENELVVHYPLDGNALNMIEDKNHGIETNVQYGEDRKGNPNSSCFFSGDESFITIPHTEDLNWDARTESYSILFWVRSGEPLHGGSAGGRIMSKWSENLQDPYPFSFPFGETDILTAIKEVSASALNIRTSGFWDDRWHLITMLYDYDQQTMVTYIDNEFIESKTHEFGGTTSNTTDILIGKRLVTNIYYRGYVDDIYFYDRVINECEIEALYSGQLLEER